MNDGYLKETIPINVAKRVKSFRKDRGLTQEKLSEMLEVTPTFIAMIETGKTGISLETLIKISKALSVTPNDILQDYIQSYKEDELSEYIYNKITTMSDRDKKLMLKISEHFIAED